ncbi:hypothetical protein, partial [Staphylococcus aureus]
MEKVYVAGAIPEVDMVSKGHDVKLYCRNQSISKFQNA